jgi:hypothetical protein
MTVPLPPAYFIPDGDALVPTAVAKGSWGRSISGNFVGGVLGHAIERDEGDAEVLQVWAYGRNPDLPGRSFDLTQWQHDGPKFVWLRDVKPLVEGVPMTPFTRAAMAGDVASSLTHYGTEGLHYINADYTLTLSRLPEGPDIGLAALTFSGHGGVATATTLANPGFSPRSAG